MAQAVTVKIHGLKEIEKNLRELREKFSVRTGGIVIRGLREGARVVRDEARRRVPHVPSGFVPPIDFNVPQKGRGRKRRFLSWEALLRTNIIEHAIPTGSKLAGGKPTVIIRVRNHGYTRRNGKIYFNRPGSSPGWWWWLEFGTSKFPARPFLRPAFEAKKRAAVDAALTKMREEIDDFFVSTIKKAA